jgi:serine phosphatase RsbU (regulator of sigma subunit)
VSDRTAKKSDREPKVEPVLNEDGDGSPAEASPPAEEEAPTANPANASAGPKTNRFKRGIVKRNTESGTPAAPSGATPAVKKGKPKKKPKEDDKALELEPISPFRRGISIGVKFAAASALTAIIAVASLGTLTYSITKQEVNDQITQGGVASVSALEKGVDRVSWIRPDAMINEIVDKDKPETPDPNNRNPVAMENYEKAKKEWEAGKARYWELMKKTSQDALIERLKTLVTQSSNQILSAAIYEKGGGAIASYPEKLGFSSSFLEKRGPVDVSEGRLTLDGQSVLIRQFDKPITDADGKPLPPQTPGATPYASVFVNAKKIDDVEDRVFNRIAVVTALFALAGVIVSALVAAIVSRPIRALEGDIAKVAEGNLEHETVVRSRDEIGGLAHTFNIMTRNVRAAQSHAADRKAIERELSIATEIQTKLLPERIPQIPGLDIHSFYLSAKEVGGDYYDFIVIDQTHLGIIVADVSGKGIPGSMVMTMARSLVRLASVRNVSPADTFKKVNRILAKDIRRGMFVTSIYMVLNVKTHELKVASAGHNPLVLFRAETGEYELVKPQGIALGFDKGTIFDNHIQEVAIQLKPGDRICAYTDGVNEAMNAESEEFGDERFYNLVKQHSRLSSKDFVNAIVAELEGHRGQAEQSDDITITTLAVMK